MLGLIGACYSSITAAGFGDFQQFADSDYFTFSVIGLVRFYMAVPNLPWALHMTIVLSFCGLERVVCDSTLTTCAFIFSALDTYFAIVHSCRGFHIFSPWCVLHYLMLVYYVIYDENSYSS